MADHDDDDIERALPPRAPGEGVRIIGAEEAASKVESGEATGRRAGGSRFGDVPPAPRDDVRPTHRFPLPEHEDARPAVSPGEGTGPELPHWTEPPTGEVPRILPEAEGDADEDLEAWSSFTGRGPRWRDQRSDWEEGDDFDADLLASDEPRIGALDEEREADQPWAFDDEPEPEPEPQPAMRRVRSAPPRPRPAPPAAARTRRDLYESADAPRTDRNLVVAVGTGVAVAAAALVCFALGPAWSAAFVTVIVLLAAVEVFDVFRRAGYRPATLLGLVATAALLVGTYLRGERAVPLVLVLAAVFTMLWYLLGVVKARPTINLGVTLLGLLWVGLLGSFATLLLRYPNREGIAFLLGGVLAVVANDVGALFAGRRFGTTPLAPEISPNKTVEGFVGGLLLALVVSAVLVSRIDPWSLGSALALGVVVSIVAPVGDLCESMIKRDLGVKDMGTILPGHGGVLDRFDALLFALPAVYYLVELLDVATV